MDPSDRNCPPVDEETSRAFQQLCQGTWVNLPCKGDIKVFCYNQANDRFYQWLVDRQISTAQDKPAIKIYDLHSLGVPADLPDIEKARQISARRSELEDMICRHDWEFTIIGNTVTAQIPVEDLEELGIDQVFKEIRRSLLALGMLDVWQLAKAGTYYKMGATLASLPSNNERRTFLALTNWLANKTHYRYTVTQR